MRGGTPAGFLDLVFGYHETEVVLDCMLDSNYHRDFLQRPYRPLRKGFVKDFYSDRDKTISSSGIVPILTNMKSYYSGWVENAGRTDVIHETVDLETETGCVYLVHDDPEVVKHDFELLMEIEEHYPKLLYSDEPLFLLPENESEITPEIEKVLNMDTEILISKIIAYNRNGEKGAPVVPEKLLDASPYNRSVMEMLERI